MRSKGGQVVALLHSGHSPSLLWDLSVKYIEQASFKPMEERKESWAQLSSVENTVKYSSLSI